MPDMRAFMNACQNTLDREAEYYEELARLPYDQARGGFVLPPHLVAWVAEKLRIALEDD